MGVEPLVSIISVNYKQTDITKLFLASLRQITYKNIEIIIIDNGSGDDFGQVIEQNFPEAKLILSKENLGFAGGNNLGVRVAKGKYVMFLNNDTEVEPNFLEPLVSVLEENPKIGIASPKIIYYQTNNLIQYAGCEGINPYTGRGAKIGHMVKDDGSFNITKRTDLAHGAAMIVPLEVIKKVGMLPELFFLYYEEHDWTEMIKRAGFEVYYIGNSTVYHKESVSVGKDSPLKTYYMTRNRLLFTRRNKKGIELWVSLLFFAFLAVPKNTIFLLLKRRFDLLSSFYKGIFWNLSHFKIDSNVFLTT